MSESKLDEIQKKIKKIEAIGTSINKSVQKPVPKPKEYGSYQHFQRECMKRVDTKPDSPSRIEVITGKDGIHSTERLVQCSVLWGKHRNLDNPIDGLMNDLKVAQKTEKDNKALISSESKGDDK